MKTNILSDNCKLELPNETVSYSYSLGTIIYSSENSYFFNQFNILKPVLFNLKKRLYKEMVFLHFNKITRY